MGDIWLNEYTINTNMWEYTKKSKKSLDLNRKYERMIMRWWVFCLTTYWTLAHILTITVTVGNTGSVKSLTWKYSRGGKLLLQINCLRAAIAYTAHIIKYLQKRPFGWNLKNAFIRGWQHCLKTLDTCKTLQGQTHIILLIVRSRGEDDSSSISSDTGRSSAKSDIAARCSPRLSWWGMWEIGPQLSANSTPRSWSACFSAKMTAS